MTYYKAVRPDGTDFQTGTVRWLPPVGGTLPDGGRVVEHPHPDHGQGHARHYLSVSVAPTDCTGMSWPCRLAEVEPVDGCEPWTPRPDRMPHKWAACRWRVVREVDSLLALGPQAAHIVALVERAERATPDEAAALAKAWYAAWGAAWYAARGAVWYAARYAARDAARDAAWGAVWDAARYAARDAAQDAAWGAAWGAATALVVRDLIPAGVYATLTRPWATVIGRVHPGDPEVAP